MPVVPVLLKFTANQSSTGKGLDPLLPSKSSNVPVAWSLCRVTDFNITVSSAVINGALMFEVIELISGLKPLIEVTPGQYNQFVPISKADMIM